MRFNAKFGIIVAVFWSAVLGGIDPGLAATKKGIAIGSRDAQAAQKLSTLGAGWYYTWNTTPVAAAEAEFVPMVWGRRPADVPVSCHLLLFNEPDGRNQADMSVAEAVKLAVPLSRQATYLGSPAAVNAMGGWFVQFDQAAEEAGLGIDFVAMHWYGAPAVAPFLRRIDAVHARYGKPIWLTEFAVADWSVTRGTRRTSRYSAEQTAAFLRKVLPELERRPYVARYAWMGAGTISPAIASSRLFDAQGRLTEVGRVYRDFASGEQPRPQDC